MMIGWAAFAREAPALAQRGRALLDRFQVAYLATTRRDGSPRLHPVVPVIAAEGIYVAVPVHSPKRRDLRDDRRFALHAPLGDRDEEFLIVGAARLVSDITEARAVAAAARHVIRSSDDIFELRIARCYYGYWENVGQPDTYAVRRRWPSPQG